MITNVDDLLGLPTNTPKGVFTNAEQIKGVPVDDTNIGNGKALVYDSANDKLIYSTPSSTSSPVISVNSKTGAVVLSKSDIGLNNVNNTTDIHKGVVTDFTGFLQTTSKTLVGAINEVNAKPTGTGLVNSINGKIGEVVLGKSDIGLSNVDNTSDLNKPVSTAQQTALDLKVDKVLGKGLSTNDLTDTLKSQYDQVVLNNHTHTNKVLLDSLVSNGDGTKYLSDDGTYKLVQGLHLRDTFVELTDTPNSYVGQEGKYLRVNTTANGLEFIEGSGGGGVASFTQLNDTPSSYVGKGGKVVSVKVDETGLEFTQSALPTQTSDLINDSNFVSDSNYVHTDNNYTTIEKNKLATIQEGADENVQSDWNEIDNLSDSYIKNKPTIPTKISDLTNDSNFVVDSSYVHTDNNYTSTEKTKLSGVQEGAEVNVNADWNSISGDSLILNKPTVVDTEISKANPSKSYVVKNNNLVDMSLYSVGTFSDVPDSKIGQKGKALVVSQDETTYEFSTGNLVNVKSDWNTVDTNDDSYIKNKPSLVSAFLGLSDVPSSYATHGGKMVTVKDDESGLEFTIVPEGSGGGSTITSAFKPILPSQIANISLSDSAGRSGATCGAFPNWSTAVHGIWITKLSNTLYDIQYALQMNILNTNIATGAKYSISFRLDTGLGSAFTTANNRDVTNGRNIQTLGNALCSNGCFGGDFSLANGILYVRHYMYNTWNVSKSTFNLGLSDSEVNWYTGRLLVNISGTSSPIPLPTL